MTDDQAEQEAATEPDGIDAYRPMGCRADRPLGPRMTQALEFIRTHPGTTKTEVRQALGTYPNPLGRVARLPGPAAQSRLGLRPRAVQPGRAVRVAAG